MGISHRAEAQQTNRKGIGKMSNSDHWWWFFVGVELDATKQATHEAYRRLAKRCRPQAA